MRPITQDDRRDSEVIRNTDWNLSEVLRTVACEMLGSAADAEDVELAESVSMAMLTVPETLGPPNEPGSCCARSSTCPTTRSPESSGSRW